MSEEVWSWWQAGSVHGAPWPSVEPLAAAGDGDPLVLDVAAEVLAEVRKAKTSANRSLRAGVSAVTVVDGGARIEALRAAERDLREAGRIRRLDLEIGARPAITVRLEPDLDPGLAAAGRS